jgi:hypothetical protein
MEDWRWGVGIVAEVLNLAIGLGESGEKVARMAVTNL